jgi:hypothetical protein
MIARKEKPKTMKVKIIEPCWIKEYGETKTRKAIKNEIVEVAYNEGVHLIGLRRAVEDTTPAKSAKVKEAEK